MTAAFRDKNTFLVTRSVLRCPPKAAPATPGDSLSIRKSSPGRTRHQTEGGATSIVACLRLCFWESHEPPFWSRISMTADFRDAVRCPPKTAPMTPGHSLSVRTLRSAHENHELAPLLLGKSQTPFLALDLHDSYLYGRGYVPHDEICPDTYVSSRSRRTEFPHFGVY